MLVLTGNGGTGKTYLVSQILPLLDSANINYSVVSFGEPDAIHLIEGVNYLSDFIEFFNKFNSDVIILDSLRLVSSLKGVLGKGGVNKNMANYITFLELCAKKSGKVFVATFNPLDDDENIGGYFNILKSSCSSVILLDDTTTNLNFDRIHRVSSAGFLNGQVLVSSRFSETRNNEILKSSEVPAYIVDLILAESDYLTSHPEVLELANSSIMSNLLFDVVNRSASNINDSINSTSASTVRTNESSDVGRFNNNDKEITRNRRLSSLNADDGFSSFKVD